MRPLAFILVSMLTTGCAATPEGSVPASTVARPAAAPPAIAPPAARETAAPVESVAGAGKQAATAPSSGKDGKAEFIPPPGYRAVKKGGETLYCATIKPIGSNLTKTACYSQVQLEVMERQRRDSQREIAEKQGVGASGGA